MLDRVVIPAGGAPAPALEGRAIKAGEPLLLEAVDVVDPRVAGLLDRTEKGVEERVVAVRSGQHLGPGVPVVGVAASQAVLQPSEVRQAMRKIPVLEPGLTSPALVI
jgi:hypothetical protein